MMSNLLTPIIIIGSARNGTTNLENTIASFPEVAGVEHWLHHGSHESNIYKNRQFWGDFTSADAYLQFLHQYAGSDYFQLCEGDISYHLEHKQADFYAFFLDLMDNHAKNKGTNYWITKLDPSFFINDAERKTFFSLLNKRYERVKVIRIKRNFADAFVSYMNMEGENYDLRQRSIFLIPALVYQASRYTLIYSSKIEGLDADILDIAFDKYITDRKTSMQTIADYLSVAPVGTDVLELNRFQVNSSFKKEKRRSLPNSISVLLPGLLALFKALPFIPKRIWGIYFRLNLREAPIYRRLLKYRYFREDLIQELSAMNAMDLVQKIKEDAAVLEK